MQVTHITTSTTPPPEGSTPLSADLFIFRQDGNSIKVIEKASGNELAILNLFANTQS